MNAFTNRRIIIRKAKSLEVKKKKELREISIDGCRKIGEGAHGVVYQTAPDMLVKVYREGVSLDDIHREQALCRRAFVKGIPTAIPFGVVRVGGHYGTMFELLNAKSASDYWIGSSKSLSN